jgi:hypothetical protein
MKLMAGKTEKTKSRRVSKSQRKHIRRLKEEARKAGVPYK